MSRLRLDSLPQPIAPPPPPTLQPPQPHYSIFPFLALRCLLLDFMMPKIDIVNEASERSEHFFEKSKLLCERSEQALRRSYQNLARSANFLLVIVKLQSYDSHLICQKSDNCRVYCKSYSTCWLRINPKKNHEHSKHFSIIFKQGLA